MKKKKWEKQTEKKSFRCRWNQNDFDRRINSTWKMAQSSHWAKHCVDGFFVRQFVHECFVIFETWFCDYRKSLWSTYICFSPRIFPLYSIRLLFCSIIYRILNLATETSVFVHFFFVAIFSHKKNERKSIISTTNQSKSVAVASMPTTKSTPTPMLTSTATPTTPTATTTTTRCHDKLT